MKQKFSILLLFLISSTVFAQKHSISGFICDKENGKGIPYAAVAFYKKAMGTSANVQGNFELDIPKDLKSKYIHISSVGYRDTIMSIDNFKTKQTILLTPKIIQIPEVVVLAKPKKKKRIVLNKIKRTFINQSMYRVNQNPMVVARYFPYNPAYHDCIITEIKMNFERYHDYKMSPKFHLRVLNYDTLTGKPNSDILERTLVEMDSCEPTYNYIQTIDLRKYNLQIPEGGLLVGIEWIVIEENKTNYNVGFQGISPGLKAKYGVNPDKNVLWRFEGGEWNCVEGENPYIEVVLEN